MKTCSTRRHLRWAILFMAPALVVSLAMGCDSEESSSTIPILNPVIRDLAQVVPSTALPGDLDIQHANNNLDIVRHDGRLWLAFRTAPNHFANADTVLHVLSTEDEESWRLEASFERGTDLREPRFLSWNGRLFFYFSVLGTNPMDFEPQGLMVSEWDGERFSEPEAIYIERFIAWRTTVIDGVPYMLGYQGGEGIYDLGGAQMDLHWLTTEDGRDWHGVIPAKPVMLTGGGSEADIAFAPDGALIAAIRNEAGDELGFGSRICRAEPESLGDWACIKDARKYDSPLVFTHEGAILLIGRRNVTEDGAYDLGMDHLSPQKQWLTYELEYWNTPKRCAFWQIDPVSLAVTWLLDLPSAGDTCFPGLVENDNGTYTIYNYSSPLGDDEDHSALSWRDGQLGETRIYRMTLEL